MKTSDSGSETAAVLHAEADKPAVTEHLFQCVDIQCIGYGNPFPSIGDSVACLHCKGATMRLD